MRVVRPIVRQFKVAFAREAARHVRAGGHAIVWESEKRARLVIPVPKKGDEGDLGLWSIMDLGKWRWRKIESGPLRGLASMIIPGDCYDIVRHRAERDSTLEGTTREVDFDCLACGACCKDNEVVLYDVDVRRLKKGGREDLTRPPFARKDKEGRLVFTLKKTKAKECKHLGSDNKCGVYELRPDACSTFPVGSECCLFARETELGIVDGAAS
jgi:Fe-S-cluster containining protein